MFGLTGPLFSLGVTILLSTLLMYYCRQKFREYEHKLETMSNLLTSVITQLNSIPASVYDNSGLVGGDTTEYTTGNDNSDKRIHITETTESMNPYENLNVNSMQTNLDENSESSESESDSDSNNDSDNDSEKDEIVVTVNRDEINTASLSIPIEEVTIAVSEATQETSHETPQETTQETTPEATENIKVVAVNDFADNLDYSKMTLPALKQLVSEKKLGTSVSRMKKQEIVDLLTNNNNNKNKYI